MTSDLDIYRSAKILVAQHGEDAPLRASVQAERFRKAGDGERVAVWLRIMKAAEELLAEKLGGGAAVQRARERRTIGS